MKIILALRMKYFEGEYSPYVKTYESVWFDANEWSKAAVKIGVDMPFEAACARLDAGDIELEYAIIDAYDSQLSSHIAAEIRVEEEHDGYEYARVTDYDYEDRTFKDFITSQGGKYYGI